MNRRLFIFILLNQLLISTIIFSKKYEAPEEYLIKDFPGIAQPDDVSCGPTSCAMVLKKYGKEVSVADAKKAGRTTWFRFKGQEVGMTSPDHIPKILEKYGVPAKLRSGNVDRLKFYVSTGRPVIVLLRSGTRYWHYVVVVGYGKDYISIADPGPGSVWHMDQTVFQRAWSFQGDMQGAKIETTDWYRWFLQLADVRGNLMIVPKYPLPSG